MIGTSLRSPSAKLLVLLLLGYGFLFLGSRNGQGCEEEGPECKQSESAVCYCFEKWSELTGMGVFPEGKNSFAILPPDSLREGEECDGISDSRCNKMRALEKPTVVGVDGYKIQEGDYLCSRNVQQNFAPVPFPSEEQRKKNLVCASAAGRVMLKGACDIYMCAGTTADGFYCKFQMRDTDHAEEAMFCSDCSLKE